MDGRAERLDKVAGEGVRVGGFVIRRGVGQNVARSRITRGLQVRAWR
jgi:hypothetical protein